MSQVNLLPPDILQAQRYRRLTSGVVVAGVVLVAAVFGFYLLQSNELSSVNDEIAAQEATNASIQASIAEKQKYADLQAEAQAQQQLLSAAYAGEVSFSALLMDFSRVIPSDAYVNSLAIQADQAAAAGADGADPGPDRRDHGQWSGGQHRHVVGLPHPSRAGEGLGQPVDVHGEQERGGQRLRLLGERGSHRRGRDRARSKEGAADAAG